MGGIAKYHSAEKYVFLLLLFYGGSNTGKPGVYAADGGGNFFCGPGGGR